jgi:hypothetical protein
LDGLAIGISIGNSEDLAQVGYTPDDVNRVTVRLCEALLQAGARLVFGHDWRPDGVMDAICRVAVKYQPPMQTKAGQPLIQNLLAWPEEPKLNSEVRRDLEQRGVMRIETVGLPEGDFSSLDQSTQRAIALTHLRRELSKQTDARVCLGGKERSAAGFFAGIVEEAAATARENKPLYLSKLLGGAAARIVDALQQPELAESLPSLHVLATQGEAYRQLVKQSHERAASRATPPASPDEFQPPEDDLMEVFRNDVLQHNSGLGPEDWSHLLNALDVDTFVSLVIRGLKNRPAPSSEAHARTESDSGPAPGQTEQTEQTEQAGQTRKQSRRKGQK